ncbi:MAG TPA: serine hydrolase [Chitinophagaceae bacterium]|nr:serine hydrolase [Chitinophagaceae bacterium]
MKKILVIVLTMGLTQSLFSQDTTAKKIDELITAYLQSGKFNGSILVALHGKILLEKGYGFKNIKENTFNDSHTIFQIASVTKQFTATVILKLVELKKMSLTDKVSKYYPDFPKADSIRIENLLTHTSGISDHSKDTSFKIYNGSGEETFLASMKRREFDFSPGTSWNYSNSGYILLGYIIQKVSGMTYYEALRKYIFIPLKMNNSAFDFIHLMSKDKATGYWSFPESIAADTATLIDSSGPRAAGAIYSTIGDLYKWHEGLQTYKMVSKSSLEKAYTPFKNHYGYGWMIDSLFNKRIIHHSGDIWGFKSDIARVTEDDVCIVLLNNIESPDLGIITKNILAILYNQPYQLPAKNEIKLGDEILKKYIGSYEMQPGMVIEVTLENGHLMATTDHKEELYAQKENYFIADSGNNQLEIEFVNDEIGKIDNLFFYKEKQKIICKKIK